MTIPAPQCNTAALPGCALRYLCIAEHHIALPLGNRASHCFTKASQHHTVQDLCSTNQCYPWLNYTDAAHLLAVPLLSATMPYHCSASLNIADAKQSTTGLNRCRTRRNCAIPSTYQTSDNITLPRQNNTRRHPCRTAHRATVPYRYKAPQCQTVPYQSFTSLRFTEPLLHRNYDIRYINPINDFTLHSKPVYCYTIAALRLGSHHRDPAALHNAIPLQSETTQDRAIPAHYIALLCHTTASHSLAKRHLAIATLTRAKRNLAIPLHYIS